MEDGELKTEWFLFAFFAWFAVKKPVFVRLLRLLTANQSKCLSINHLHPTAVLFQSSPIQSNQG